jgi:hypothetical protein
MNNHPEGLSDGQIELLRRMSSDYGMAQSANELGTTDDTLHIMAGRWVASTRVVRDRLKLWYRAYAADDLIETIDRKERETAERTKGAVEFALDTLAAVASSVKVERVSPHLWTDADRAQVRLRAAFPPAALPGEGE